MGAVPVAVQGLEHRASHSSVLLLPIRQAKHRNSEAGKQPATQPFLCPCHTFIPKPPAAGKGAKYACQRH